MGTLKLLFPGEPAAAIGNRTFVTQQLGMDTRQKLGWTLSDFLQASLKASVILHIYIYIFQKQR